jgi:hypothetical protein
VIAKPSLQELVFGPRTVVALPAPSNGGVSLDDRELLDKMFASKSGSEIRALWHGDVSGFTSHSEADMALLAHLRFWTANDRERMTRLFESSGCYRESKVKSSRGYVDRTVDNVLATGGEVYQPTRQPARVALVTAEEASTVNGVAQQGRARLYDLGAYNSGTEAAGIDWQIDEWFVRDKIHLTVGPEKRGKSTQAWRRVEAISAGGRYLERFQARQGRVLVMTEMDDAGIHQLLEDDDTEPDWDRVRVLFLDEYQPDERLKAIQDACESWHPVHLVLDPIDECLGLDDQGVFNPATTSVGFDVLRTLARSGVTIDALYHFNNQGKIANSYKFRSKPDHIFTLHGGDASDLTIEYQGRLRTIPRKRRLRGNGHDGYEVVTLVGEQRGRPAKSQQLVVDHLRQVGQPLPIPEVARGTGMHYHAARKALARGVKAGLVVNENGYYRPTSTAPSNNSETRSSKNA